MQQPIIIFFAGVPGSGKTPVAYYLSWNLGLPVFNNDAMRTEVREDLGHFDQHEYEMRRDRRLDLLMKTGHSFIYDASVDRSWPQVMERLEKYGYRSCVISFDLTEKFVCELYDAKGYGMPAMFEQFFTEHDTFTSHYSEKIIHRISDATFSDRLNSSLKAIKDLI